MALPTIRACIICEGIRPEIGTKATILGFFGLLPDVEVWLKKLSDPVTFTFLFPTATSTVDASPTFSVEIINPDGSTLAVLSPPLRAEMRKGKPTLIGVSAVFQFKTIGQYKIRLSLDGQRVYEDVMQVKLASSPEDVARFA